MSVKYYVCSECESVNRGDGPCPTCKAKSSFAAPTGLAAVEPPENFGNDEISKAMRPRTLKRYSMVNTTTSHAYMREDPAGDWVMWSEAANADISDRRPE